MVNVIPIHNFGKNGATSRLYLTFTAEKQITTYTAARDRVSWFSRQHKIYSQTCTMSLFKRPAWAQTQASDQKESDQNIFSHSSHSYNEIVAEEQRKKKQRAEKQKLKQECRSSGKRDIKDEQEKRGGGSPKRRRITFEEGEDLLGSVGLSSAIVSRRAEGNDNIAEDDGQDSPVRKSPRLNRHVNKDRSGVVPPSKVPRAAVVELGDSDNEVVQQPRPAQQPRPVQQEAQDEDESDDEFAELARQARAQRNLKEDAKKSQTPDVRTPTPGQDAADAGRTGYPSPPLPDPPVKFFISSELPGTQPLIVYRKLSQRLQEIRQVWCSKQGFSEQQTQDIFLIHRMRKLYDVTTCKSLGLYVNEDGNVAMKGAEGLDGVDQVHLEAVTDAIFARLKAEKDAKDRKRNGLLLSEDDAEAEASEAPQAASGAKEESLIRILLKGKGVSEPYKLKVKPVRATPANNMVEYADNEQSTLFSKIMTACRPHFKVGDEQSLFLEFDGDRLDPSEDVQTTDIEDMDSIDVHIV